MLLKVCGLNNVENISRLLALRPDVIGFVFHPASPRYAGRDAELAAYAKTIGGVKKAGVFVQSQATEIEEKIDAFGLDIVQLHGGQDVDFCREIKQHAQVIKVFPVNSDFNVADTTPFVTVCDYFLFDTGSKEHGGTGMSFDWQLIADAVIAKPFFLSGGLHPGNIKHAMMLPNRQLRGLDINSRYEISPGLKNITLVKQTIDEIRS